MNKRNIGENYEKMAGEYLEKQGYDIIQYNYRCKYGEIDIVAKDKCDLVFAEVKYRSNIRYGLPFEAVDIKKQQKINKVAVSYLIENNISENTYIRFDVVGICNKEIKLIKNAFGGM